MSDPVRPLVVIAAVEALAVVVAFVAVGVAAVGGTDGLTGAAAGTAEANMALWGLLVVAMLLILQGLNRRRAAARTPFLLVQLFVMVVVPLFWGSDLVVWRVVAASLGALAVAGLILGLRPAVRGALSGRFPNPTA